MDKKNVVLFVGFLFMLSFCLVGVQGLPSLASLNMTDGHAVLFSGSTITSDYFLYPGTITLNILITDNDVEGLDSIYVYCAGGASLTNLTYDSLTMNNVTGQNITQALYPLSFNLPDACRVNGNVSAFFLAVNTSETTNYTEFYVSGNTPYSVSYNDTINPIVDTINLTYTFTDSDGGSSTRTITSLTNAYVAPKNLTFNVGVSGEQKSTRLLMFFNNESYTLSNLANGQFDHVNVSVTFVNLTEVEDITAATIGLFEGSVDTTGWADNTSTEFYILANNTGDNYTYIAGPYRFQVDIAKPSASITPPSDLTINPRDSIKYKCVGSDSGAGVYMYKFTLTKPDASTKATDFSTSDEATFTGDDTSQFGEYSVKCTVLDYAGNEESDTTGDSETFKVVSSLSSYSTSGGGGESVEGAPAFDIDLSTSESGEVKALQGAIKKFTLDGTTEHTMTFVEVTSNSVTLEFASDPVLVTLNVGEKKEIDIDGDGTNDLSVNLVSVINSKADVIIKRAAPPAAPPAETPPAETPPAEQPPAEEVIEEEAGTGWIWIVLIIVLLVLVVGYFLLRKKKQ